MEGGGEWVGHVMIIALLTKEPTENVKKVFFLFLVSLIILSYNVNSTFKIVHNQPFLGLSIKIGDIV